MVSQLVANKTPTLSDCSAASWELTSRAAGGLSEEADFVCDLMPGIDPGSKDRRP